MIGPNTSPPAAIRKFVNSSIPVHASLGFCPIKIDEPGQETKVSANSVGRLLQTSIYLSIFDMGEQKRPAIVLKQAEKLCFNIFDVTHRQSSRKQQTQSQ
jgi:hypothetical protein